MGRERTSSEDERKERRRSGRSNFQIEFARASDRLIRKMRENPPNLLCWLRGGVDLPRAKEIQEDLEKRP